MWTGQLPFWDDCPRQAVLLGSLFSCPPTLPFSGPIFWCLRDSGLWHFSCLCLPQFLSPLLSDLPQQGLISLPLHNRSIGLPGTRQFPKINYLGGYVLGHSQTPDNSFVQSLNPKANHFPNERKKRFILCHTGISLIKKKLMALICNTEFC